MLSKVRAQNKVEASKVLLAMSNSVENCLAMRECGKMMIHSFFLLLLLVIQLYVDLIINILSFT